MWHRKSFIRKSMRYYLAIFKGLPAGCENTLRTPAGKVLLHPGEHFLGKHRAINNPSALPWGPLYRFSVSDVSSSLVSAQRINLDVSLWILQEPSPLASGSLTTQAQVTSYFVKQTDELRAAIIEESQPVKNRDLSRLIANLSRQNWSSERNSVHCFSKVYSFTTARST